jgi:hypothetical protein
MGTTNALQWNPTAANQETDAEYLADAQRLGGATDPSLFDAALANKLFYQCTTYIDALFTAFANKGFTTSDANLATLTAQCGNFLTTADVRPPLLQVAYTSSPSFNTQLNAGFQMILTGNVTGMTVASYAAGQTVLLAFTQDSAGGHTVTFPSLFKSPGTVDPTPGATSIQSFICLVDSTFHPLGPMVVS